jgi:hypothetical protein
MAAMVAGHGISTLVSLAAQIPYANACQLKLLGGEEDSYFDC